MKYFSPAKQEKVLFMFKFIKTITSRITLISTLLYCDVIDVMTTRYLLSCIVNNLIIIIDHALNRY